MARDQRVRNVPYLGMIYISCVTVSFFSNRVFIKLPLVSDLALIHPCMQVPFKAQIELPREYYSLGNYKK